MQDNNNENINTNTGPGPIPAPNPTPAPEPAMSDTNSAPAPELEKPVEPAQPAESAEPIAAPTVSESVQELAPEPAQTTVPTTEPNSTPNPTPVQPTTFTSAQGQDQSQSQSQPQAPARSPIDLYPAAPQPESQKVDETKPKKKKTGLIIGVAVGAALALAVGGVGVVYAITNQPENAVLGAISNFISSDTVQTSGVVTAHILEEDYYIKEISLTLKNNSANINNSSELHLNLQFHDKYNIKPVDINLGTTFIKDGTAYIKISELTKTLKATLPSVIDTLTEDATVYKEMLSEVYKKIENFIYEVAGEIEDVWWKVDISEILEKMGVDEKQKTATEKLYSCVINEFVKEYNKRSEYQEIYKKHPFAAITAGDNKTSKGAIITNENYAFYDVKINEDKLFNFMQDVEERSVFTGISKCQESYEAELNGEDYISDDEEDYEDDTNCIDNGPDTNCLEPAKENPFKDYEFPEIIVGVEGLFSKQLRGIYVSGSEKDFDDEDELTYSISLEFDYKELLVSAPKDSKSVTELFDSITEKFNKISEEFNALSTGFFGEEPIRIESTYGEDIDDLLDNRLQS